MSVEIIPFGKHKGKPVFTLADDKAYAEWLLAQPWFKEKHLNIYNVVINNFRQPDDSPEHNAMQIKFLDQNYALKLAYHLEPTLFNLSSSEINAGLKAAINSKTMYLDVIKNKLPEFNETNLLNTSSPSFEQGYDVAYSVKYGVNFYVTHRNTFGDTVEVFSYSKANYISIQIEIKPTIGDDFPAVLRQMKASMPITYDDYRKSKCLLVGTYTGVGATKEQFVQFFQSQKYKVVFASDIDNIKLPNYEDKFQLDHSSIA